MRHSLYYNVRAFSNKLRSYTAMSEGGYQLFLRQ